VQSWRLRVYALYWLANQWQKIAYVLSIKILDPQFSGQTKERLSSRECAGFVSTNGFSGKQSKPSSEIDK
jgi:hypothetical protein